MQVWVHVIVSSAAFVYLGQKPDPNTKCNLIEIVQDKNSDGNLFVSFKL